MPSPQMGQLLNKLKGVKSKGNGGYLSLCPSHGDRQRSLSIDERDGTILLKCFVGCTVEAIMAAIASTPAALFEDGPQPPHNLRTTSAQPPHARREVSSTTYAIKDADGTVLGLHIRTDFEDGTKTFRWDALKCKLADMPLYRQWEIPSGAPFVILVEGEKACDALAAAGYSAISTYGAEAIPSIERLHTLDGMALFLWPDNDDAGRRCMDRIAGLLTSIGNPPLILQYLSAQPKDDAADYISRGLVVDIILGAGRVWEDSWIYGAATKPAEAVPAAKKQSGVW